MDLTPKLIAAADMCEAGEEVNLDELAFLLRYAADELKNRPEAVRERDSLLERLRARVLARCELLHRGEEEMNRAREGSLAELEALDDALDTELREAWGRREDVPPEPQGAAGLLPVYRYRSGR